MPTLLKAVQRERSGHPRKGRKREGREGRRVGETGHFVAATQLLFLVTAKLRFVSRQLPKDRGKFNGTSSNHPPLETISIRF